MAGKKGQAPRVEFSQALFDSICKRIADGKSVRQACSGTDMPDRATFNGWRKRTPELQAQYDLACIEREEVYFEQIIEIADDSSGDAMDVDGLNIANPEFTQRSKIRIDARKWALARMNRKKYGDRLLTEHTGEDGGAIQVVHAVHLVPMKKDGS